MGQLGETKIPQEIKPLNVNPTRSANSRLSAFDHFVGLVLKGLWNALMLLLTMSFIALLAVTFARYIRSS